MVLQRFNGNPDRLQELKVIRKWFRTRLQRQCSRHQAAVTKNWMAPLTPSEMGMCHLDLANNRFRSRPASRSREPH
jgi:hypothetical protein